MIALATIYLHRSVLYHEERLIIRKCVLSIIWIVIIYKFSMQSIPLASRKYLLRLIGIRLINKIQNKWATTALQLALLAIQCISTGLIQHKVVLGALKHHGFDRVGCQCRWNSLSCYCITCLVDWHSQCFRSERGRLRVSTSSWNRDFAFTHFASLTGFDAGVGFWKLTEVSLGVTSCSSGWHQLSE